MELFLNKNVVVRDVGGVFFLVNINQDYKDNPNVINLNKSGIKMIELIEKYGNYDTCIKELFKS